MIRVLRSLFDKYFSQEEAVILLLLLVLATGAVMLFGKMLAPVIAALIIAFILQGMVTALRRMGVSQTLSSFLVFSLFIGTLLAFLFGLLPLVWSQVTALAGELPRIFRAAQDYIELLPRNYPQLVSYDALDNLFQQITAEAARLTQTLVSISLQSIPGLVAILIYLVVVPILVFFFLKDRERLMLSFAGLLPTERKAMKLIWRETNRQFANYVRGKAVEIFIVGGATYIGFKVLGLNYAALLALLVGLSVVIPFIGAAVVTLPVAMIALFQFGWGSEFIWLMAVYGIIQALDGNVLVPLLFSEVNNLHPVAIIVAVLFFGGIWGLWGVFFAIPLATLLKAIFMAWPLAPARPTEPPAASAGQA